jgi:guanylate kinase
MVVRDRSLSKDLVKSVSYTTRPRRSGEQNGRDYFFISEDEFKAGRRAKKILEWTRFLDYYYGTPGDYVEEALAAGKNIILCADIRGACAIRRLFPDETVTIFVMPPALGVLRERINRRCSRTKREEIRRRMRLARQEIAVAPLYDFRIVNTDLNRAAGELKKIIVDSLRGHKGRQGAA